MRITGGRFRGRRLPVPKIPDVRPTPSRARQAMFNIIGGIEGMAILDLFSGSGLMALEAISRGAATVISIEAGRHVFRHLRSMQSQWGLADCWRLVHGDVHAMLPGLGGRRFNLVFADPPYGRGISECIPGWLDEAGISCGRLVIEESSRIQPLWPRGWTSPVPRRYGDTTLHFLDREKPGAE